MGTTGTASSWDKIRLGMKDAEKMIGQKQYNMAMVKCRQTLEIMVRSLADKACLVDADLSVTIDDLYQGKWISKTTCDHYHKIRMIGNKAVHEGNESAYDANQAYHLLSQEVYTFSNDYKTLRPRTAKSPSSSGSNRNRRTSRKSKKGSSISQADMLRILIGVLCIIFIIALVRFLKPGKKGDAETTSPVTTEETLPETTTPPETMAQTTPTPVYKTSSVLNVRSQPSTSASIRGQLQPDTIVDYVGQHDDDWSIINYDGQQAYVATQYLVHD